MKSPNHSLQRTTLRTVAELKPLAYRMHNKLSASALFAVFILVATPLSAWSPTDHIVVGEIAKERVSDNGRISPASATYLINIPPLTSSVAPVM